MIKAVLRYSFGSIEFGELREFFILTRNDFVHFKDDVFLEQYALKLSSNAQFVSCRDSNGKIVALIAAYMNRPPLCYISHVSVLDVYKRCGIFHTMLQVLQENARLLRCFELKLEVRLQNFIAIAAYSKEGFCKMDVNGNNQYMCKLLNR